MFSLTGAVQTCSVNTGAAITLQSDRFQNPSNLFCPLWNGLDFAGRAVCVDSYYTKSPGCSSALDRVAVENYQRPHYSDFIPLDTMGYLNPSALGAPVSQKENYQKTTELMRGQAVRNSHLQGGNVGFQYSGLAAPQTDGRCGVNGDNKCTNGLQGYGPTREGYVDTRANQNFQDRRNLSNISGFRNNCYACSAGNR